MKRIDGAVSSGLSRSANRIDRIVSGDVSHDWMSNCSAGVDAPRILLVEDDPATLHTMGRLLRMDGYIVSLAASLDEAVRLSQASSFDLLISDVGLPDGSGCDLLGRLQAIRPVRGIALTGFDDEQRLACCREAGFLEQLVKPIDFGYLEQLIRRIVPLPVLS